MLIILQGSAATRLRCDGSFNCNMASLTVSDYYIFSAKYHSKRILTINQHVAKFTRRSMMAASLRRSSHLHHPVHSPLCLWSCPPFPQIDIIGAMVIVWRVRGEIIRSVLCNIVCNNCVQCDAHTYEQT